MLSGQEADLQDFGGGSGGIQSLTFRIQKHPTQSTQCGTQIKNPLDVCCSYKDLLMKYHSNYVNRIFTVNKLAGEVKVRGESSALDWRATQVKRLF